MASDMGRGIMAPDSDDPISTTGVNEMRTLGATTASAISSLDTQVQGELAERVRKDEAEQYGFEGPQGPRGPEGPPGEGEPGPPGPGGSIALEETDPGCFVDSEITWLQWDTSVGIVVRAWDPTTENYHTIYGDTGWRDISEGMADYISGTLSIKRTANIVWLRMSDIVTEDQSTSYSTWPGLIPNGFRFSEQGFIYMPLGQRSDFYTSGPLRTDRFGLVLIYNTQGQQRMDGLISWPTNQAWPTTLPGTPA